MGGWKWDLISFELPDTIKNKIKALPLQEFGHKEDSLMWNLLEMESSPQIQPTY